MTVDGFDYDSHGGGYGRRRHTEPRIAARIRTALGAARTVVNVGAGTGSYEPTDRYVIAIEPSGTMRAQRPLDLPPAIAAHAEALPLDDDAIDAAMAIATVHHWDDPAAGLRELRRVATGPVVVLTFEIDALESYWLAADYLPELVDVERARFPTVAEIADALGDARIERLPIPIGCRDGFAEAYYARPEAYLDPAVRAAQSFWPLLPGGAERRALEMLAVDLGSGEWDARHGRLRETREYDGSLRLVVSRG